MNIGIIGCGLIGKKRANALCGHNLLWAVDTDIDRAKDLAKLGENVKSSTNTEDVLNDPKVDIVIIATTNNCLAALSIKAAKAKKHILVEKPAGRNEKEIAEVVKVAKENNVLVKVGFNHRYHPALLKAKEIIDSKVLGELMFIRARYGHGGRVGYDREWRADPKLSGGGELLDQGVHLIDLSRWFMGDFEKVEGFVKTYYWDMPVDDNGFISLQTKDGQAAWLQVSCTEWKNMFCMEIYGKVGKLQIDGLGGSYGTERLAYYKMLPEMGPPETTIWEYPGADNSWKREFEDFIKSIEKKQKPNGNIEDAYAALKIVQKIYGGVE